MPESESISPLPARTRKRKARVPMYQVLKADLEREIRSGHLRVGQLVPSESALIARYHVSSTTARRCLDDLEGEGLLERRRGRGTYVSLLARMLNKQRVALVIKDFFSLAHPFLATVVGTIERTLESADIHVKIVRAHVEESSVPADVHLLEMVQHEGADQVMLLSNMPLRMVTPLVDRGIKCLGVNTRYQDGRIPHVSLDFAASLDLGLREVFKRGHRRIVILTQEIPMRDVGVMNSSSLCDEVYHAVRATFPDLPEQPSIRCASDLSELPECVREAMNESPKPTAFLCWDELAALEVTRILTEDGFDVPGQVSVIGSKLLPTSPIACMDTPLIEIARHSAEAMQEWMVGNKPKSRLIAPQGFLPRQTIGPPP